MNDGKGASGIPDGYSKCIQCGKSYDKNQTSKEDMSSCSCYAIENYCPECRPKLTLGQKALGYTYVAGGITWITVKELMLKPTVRRTRKLFKSISDWADK